MIHALIVGPRGVGKTTLIDRVLKELNRPVYGFQTKKETELTDEEGKTPVYIYEPGKPRFHMKENLTGWCSPEGFRTAVGVFDRFAQKILHPIPERSVIVFDEIGFMETKERRFRDAVISRLDGEIPVIAAVKDKEGFDFLEMVRKHPKCRCFYITQENRDELCKEVTEFMRSQINI